MTVLAESHFPQSSSHNPELSLVVTEEGEINDEPTLLSPQKRIAAAELRLANNLINVGSTALNLASMDLFPIAPELKKLTRAESEALEMMMAGLSRPEIAEELGLTISAIGVRQNGIYNKLNVHNGLAAVAIANQNKTKSLEYREQIISKLADFIGLATKISALSNYETTIYGINTETLVNDGDTVPEKLKQKSQEDPDVAANSPPEELNELTSRELDVLGLLVFGLSNSEIAGQFSIRVETIKFHLNHIYQKLNVENRTEAAVIAMRAGIVEWAAQVNGIGKWNKEPSMWGTKKVLSEKDVGASYAARAPGSFPETLEALTHRELDVVGVVAHGLSNRQAGSRLFITEQTIRFHLRHVYQKLGIKNRTELAIIANTSGLLDWAVEARGVGHGGSPMMEATKKLIAENQ